MAYLGILVIKRQKPLFGVKSVTGDSLVIRFFFFGGGGGVVGQKIWFWTFLGFLM